MSVRNNCVTMVTHPYISAKNKDNDAKVSGHDPEQRFLGQVQ